MKATKTQKQVVALYFTSKFGLQIKEFEDFLNNNNIEFKKSSGNIFIANSEITNYELVVDNRIKKMILDHIKFNRLVHIEKTGEHLINKIKTKTQNHENTKIKKVQLFLFWNADPQF